MARTIWFHVPNGLATDRISEEEAKARTLIEKKSAINLIEAFAVALKHYLRGEDGIYYQDLYYLVKFLPAYALPAGMPAVDIPACPPEEEEQKSRSSQSTLAETSVVPISTGLQNDLANSVSPGKGITIAPISTILHHRNRQDYPSLLPSPVSIGPPTRMPALLTAVSSPLLARMSNRKERRILPRTDEVHLLPAHMPPAYGIFDFFPFSLVVEHLTHKGKEVKGKKGARVRAQLRHQAISHNLPLESTLYLSSYIALLQTRKVDVPTINTLLTSLNQLVDSLTGLERILSSPIPFSYYYHIWIVTFLYCLALPFQIWPTMHWITIPSTSIISFIFFGFLVAGDEIENPFGYERNDLNLDHFTHNIIRSELKAVTSTPPPDPTRWAFVAENDLLFSDTLDERVSPDQWIARGPIAMQKNLGQS